MARIEPPRRARLRPAWRRCAARSTLGIFGQHGHRSRHSGVQREGTWRCSSSSSLNRDRYGPDVSPTSDTIDLRHHAGPAHSCPTSSLPASLNGARVCAQNRRRTVLTKSRNAGLRGQTLSCSSTVTRGSKGRRCMTVLVPQMHMFACSPWPMVYVQMICAGERVCSRLAIEVRHQPAPGYRAQRALLLCGEPEAVASRADFRK